MSDYDLEKKDETVLNFARIEKAVVEDISITNEGTFLICRCFDQSIHTPQMSNLDLTVCEYINPFGDDGSNTFSSKVLPKKGTICLIIFSTPNKFDKGFYLGAAYNPTSIPINTTGNHSDGTISFTTDKQNGLHLDGENPYAALFTANSSLILNNQTVELTNKQGSGLVFNNENFTINVIKGQNQSSIFTLGGTSSGIISSKKLDLIAVGAATLRGSAINLDAREGKLLTKAKEIETTTQGYQIVSGWFKFKTLMSSAFSTGLGPAFDVMVLEGDISLVSGLGDINIQAYSPTNEISLIVGTSIIGNSKAVLDATGFNVKVPFPVALAELNMSISGAIDLTSKTTMALDALATMDISSIGPLTIDGTASVDIKSTGPLTIDGTTTVDIKSLLGIIVKTGVAPPPEPMLMGTQIVTALGILIDAVATHLHPGLVFGPPTTAGAMIATKAQLEAAKSLLNKNN